MFTSVRALFESAKRAIGIKPPHIKTIKFPLGQDPENYDHKYLGHYLVQLVVREGPTAGSVFVHADLVEQLPRGLVIYSFKDLGVYPQDIVAALATMSNESPLRIIPDNLLDILTEKTRFLPLVALSPRGSMAYRLSPTEFGHLKSVQTRAQESAAAASATAATLAGAPSQPAEVHQQMAAASFSEPS